MSFFAEIRYKDRLKHEGHELIEKLERAGLHKVTIYNWLSQKTGRSEKMVHFANVHRVEDLKELVYALQEMVANVRPKRKKFVRHVRPKPVQTGIKLIPPHPVPKKVKSKYRDMVLPRSEMLKAIADLKTVKSVEHEGAAREIPQDSPIRRVLRQVGVIK